MSGLRRNSSGLRRFVDPLADIIDIQGRLSSVEALAQEDLLRRHGAYFDGRDDAPAIRSLANALGARGGKIILPPKLVTIATPILIQGQPIDLSGSAASISGKGTQLNVTCPDAFRFDGAGGSRMTNLYMSGSGDALASGTMVSVTNQVGGNSTNLSFEQLRVVNGFNFMKVQGAFWVNCDRVKAANFNGEQVILLNGFSDATRADAFTADKCDFSSQSGNSTTDLIVMDGKSFSHKFTNCAGNFGRNGLTMRNTAAGSPRNIVSVEMSPASGGYRVTTATNHGGTTGDEMLIADVIGSSTGDAADVNGARIITVYSPTIFDLDDTLFDGQTYSGGTATPTSGATPSFCYWSNGGFENLRGDAVRLEAGKLLQMSNAYLSTDGMGCGINVLPTFSGDYIINGNEIRGNGRDGIRIGKGFGIITGNQIINNGTYYDRSAVSVSNVENNGGTVRLTMAAAHNYATGDNIVLSGIPTLTTATTVYPITVVSPTVIDIPTLAYTTGWLGGGRTLRVAGVVTGAANNGAGLIRLTIPNHPFLTDDMILVSGIGGVTAANGEWAVTKIDANTLDLQGSAFSGTFTTAGWAQFLSANIHIMPDVQQVNITGGAAGRGGTGVNRAAYGIINRSSNAQINHVNTYGNRLGAMKATSASRFNRVRGLSTEEQVDFTLLAGIAGPVANGIYYFNNFFWIAQKKFRVIRSTRVLSAGTCSIRPRANGVNLLSASVSVTTTPSTASFNTPGESAHVTGNPFLVDFEVLNASGATDLMLQIDCQWVG